MVDLSKETLMRRDINAVFRLSNFSLPRILVTLTALISMTMILMIFLFLVKDSLRIFMTTGINFVRGTEWDIGKDVYGALPMIIGSILVTTIAMLIAVPIGIGSAIFASEILPPRLRIILKSIMELLAGIPSIVYGLMGIAILVPFIRNTFSLLTGRTVLTAGILLGIMILPTIMTISEDALKAVPREFRDAALGLGLTRMEMIRHCVLPQAFPGIIGAILLGIGRAIGETMAVMLVIGGIDRLPISLVSHIFLPSQTMTSKLGREVAEASYGSLQWSALIGLGLILFVMVIGITFAADIILIGKGNKDDKNH
jgi:phosphate ABC transporter permease protein PstC